jgi:uncharacterized protein YjiK
MLTIHPPARFSAAGKTRIDLPEPSDVAYVAGGTFLIVGDLSDELLVLHGDGRTSRHPLQGVKSTRSGMEAVAYDPERHRLFVAMEERGLLVRYSFDPASGREPEVEEKIPLDLGGPANKGVEGLTWLAAAHSPTGTPQLMLAKEQDPHALALLEADGTGSPRRIELPAGLAQGLRDFAALALDPRTGHVFVASQESATIAELSLAATGSGIAAALLAVTPLLSKKGKPFERVEGIAFDDQGDLHVLLENEGELHRMQRLA